MVFLLSAYISLQIYLSAYRPGLAPLSSNALDNLVPSDGDLTSSGGGRGSSDSRGSLVRICNQGDHEAHAGTPVRYSSRIVKDGERDP